MSPSAPGRGNTKGCVHFLMREKPHLDRVREKSGGSNGRGRWQAWGGVVVMAVASGHQVGVGV